MKPSSCTVQPDHDGTGDDEVVKVGVRLTRAEVGVLAGMCAKMTQDRRSFEERQRKTEALLLRMADSTPEERERLAGEFFYRLRAGRRLQKVRRKAPTPPVQRVAARTQAAPRERRDSSSSRSSGQDPGESGDEPPGHPWRSRRDPWALTWADRAPLIWRLAAARCCLHEIRQGVRR